MTVRLEELLAAATPPEHGESSQRWYEFHVASQKLSYLAPDAVRLLIDMGKWMDTVMAQGAPLEADFATGDVLLARLDRLGNTA